MWTTVPALQAEYATYVASDPMWAITTASQADYAMCVTSCRFGFRRLFDGKVDSALCVDSHLIDPCISTSGRTKELRKVDTPCASLPSPCGPSEWERHGLQTAARSPNAGGGERWRARLWCRRERERRRRGEGNKRPLLERTLRTAGLHRRSNKDESYSHFFPSIIHSAAAR